MVHTSCQEDGSAPLFQHEPQMPSILHFFTTAKLSFRHRWCSYSPITSMAIAKGLTRVSLKVTSCFSTVDALVQITAVVHPCPSAQHLSSISTTHPETPFSLVCRYRSYLSPQHV